MKSSTCLFVFIVGLLAGLYPLRAADSALLKVDAPIAVPDSKGRFDFLEIDNARRRLLANHTQNGTLDVFDLDSGRLLSHCPTGAAQGVAVDEAGCKYYVSVSKEQKLVAIDAKTLRRVGEVALPGPADDALFVPKSGRVYVCHDDGRDLWVVDPAAAKVETSIAIGEAPEVLVYDAGANRIYQAIKSASTVSVIDPATNRVTADWPVAPATAPHGLALDAATHRLFVAGGAGRMAVLDTASGKVVADVAIPQHVDQITIDPGLHFIYCASSTGVLAIVRETKSGVESAGEISTAKGCHSVAVDPATHAVWVAYADDAKSYIQRFQPVPAVKQ